MITLIKMYKTKMPTTPNGSPMSSESTKSFWDPKAEARSVDGISTMCIASEHWSSNSIDGAAAAFVSARVANAGGTLKAEVAGAKTSNMSRGRDMARCPRWVRHVHPMTPDRVV